MIRTPNLNTSRPFIVTLCSCFLTVSAVIGKVDPPAGTANNLASEGNVGANKAGANNRVTTNDDLTITGLVGQATVGLAGGESA